jgi:isopentenyl diphosphate isomerase/L-lactate dehydrogenase-like FMN-dependent dehydrogenase
VCSCWKALCLWTGEDGVRHVLRALCGDLTMNMHLAGLRDVNEITRDILVKESDLF